MNRRGIDWPARLTTVLAMIILDRAHVAFFGHPENTEMGVTVYLGTAAFANAASVVYFSHALNGRLSYDLQRLAFCAIILNSASWVLYMAQMSPSIINFMMGMLTYGMFTRVCWISDGDSDAGGWGDLLRRFAAERQKLHSKETN
jgi:hypothetical protein